MGIVDARLKQDLKVHAGRRRQQPEAGVRHEVADVEAVRLVMLLQQVRPVQRAVARIIEVRIVDAVVLRVPGNCTVSHLSDFRQAMGA